MLRLSIPARIANSALGTFIILAFGPSTAHAQLAPIWTGLYAGVQGGKTWAELDTDFGNANTSDGVWGLHGGYNLANGRFVLGIEGDLNLGGASIADPPDGPLNGTAETNWSGSLRVRAGMTLGPAFIYGTVGYAHLSADVDAEPVGLGSQITGTKTLTGIVYGLGAEGFVLPNVSLRLEALQYDYSMDDDRLQPYADFNETVVRAGLTIHLN